MSKAGRAAPPPQRVVGIGASAGGLDALKQLVGRLPGDTGLAFVILQHLPPSQTGLLAGLLANATTLPVIDVASGHRIEPNTIMVVPPHTAATMARGALVLTTATPGTRPTLPIDSLFVSLAAVLRERAVGVVLSGTARDGTEGLRAIHAAGGLTLAQDPATAQFDDMPRNAIAAGVVETVLPPAELGEELGAIARLPPRGVEPPGLQRILEQLREASGVDFTNYKRATIERRLARRLVRHHLTSYEAYSAYLAAHADEARTVYEDLLIHVTEFFRDGATLDTLVAQLSPDGDAPLRVWVPGCSTGQEVYSLAMLLIERFGERRSLQLFGSDLSEQAIVAARIGRYPLAIAAQVSAARLARFFTQDVDGYRINRDVRERCVFARHDLVTDPPFSRLDAVSCRNVLIYLDAVLQRRVLPVFHYALSQPGYLLLGRAETIGELGELFAVVDSEARLYARKPASRPILTFPLAGQLGRLPLRALRGLGGPFTLQHEIDQLLLARFSPPCVVVDDRLDIVQFRGRTGAYLEPPPGQPEHNLLRMARPGLASELPLAVQRARKTERPVRRENLLVRDHGHDHRFDLEVVPLHGADPARRHFLVLFEAVRAPVPVPRRAGSGAARSPMRGEPEQLRQELSATKEYLHSVVTQHLATTEDLGVANEELQSTNEELQSSNEELQTAKEELQSTNEELETVNDELERGNRRLSEANDDLQNVLGSVDIPIIMVDLERRIRRFTPRTRTVMKLIPSDVGRPIADLQTTVDAPNLDATIAAVIETLVVHESEVRDATGVSYRMQIRPYRTESHQIQGAVLSFVDVTALRTAVTEAHRLTQAREAFLDAVSHELRTPLAAILLWAQALRTLASDDPRRAVAIETIVECVNLEAQLVDDVIEVAVSRSGHLSVALLAVDPCPVIELAIAAARPEATAKRITLEVSCAPCEVIAVDARRLQQIAAGLISNAVKFTPPGGRVWIQLVRDAAGMELSVRDTGPGIAPELLPHVFEAFAQADGSSTRAHRGLGLGLVLARHLTERHGGTITAASPGVGQGTTVTVRIPASSTST